MLRSLLNLHASRSRIPAGTRADRQLVPAAIAQYKTDEQVSAILPHSLHQPSRAPRRRKRRRGQRPALDRLRRKQRRFTIEGKQPAPHERIPRPLSHGDARLLSRPGHSAARRTNSSPRPTTKGAPAVILINHAMAEKYWPARRLPSANESPSPTSPKTEDWFTVVGIVGDVKDKPDSPGAEPAFWCRPAAASRRNEAMSACGPVQMPIRNRLSPTVRNEVKRLDPALAVADVAVDDEIVQVRSATPRFAFVLVGMFAGLAMVLAAIGTYGVIATPSASEPRSSACAWLSAPATSTCSASFSPGRGHGAGWD